MNEGLSFEPVPEPPEQNRLFIIIAIGLVGMLVLGLLGIGGYVVFSRSKRTTQAQKIMQTPIVLMATDTPTVMATGTPYPTKTSTPIPTNTPVVLLSTATGVAVNEMQQGRDIYAGIRPLLGGYTHCAHTGCGRRGCAGRRAGGNPNRGHSEPDGDPGGCTRSDHNS